MSTTEPLDEIRRLEAEGIRSVAAERQSAEKRIRQAHSQAEEIIRLAREAGSTAGKIQARQALAAAEMQARETVAGAKRESKAYYERGLALMHEAVTLALTVVLGQEISGK